MSRRWTVDAYTQAEAIDEFNQFVTTYSTKYPMAAEKVEKDHDALLAFYDFPAEHWQHLRTTNPVESADQSWRRICSVGKIEPLIERYSLQG